MNKVTKTLLSVFIAGAFSMGAHAQQQNNAHEVTVTFNDENKTAFQGDYKLGKDLMKVTLEGKLTKAGLGKPSKAKGGYSLYQAVVVPDISSNKVDIYTKVDGKKSSSSVIMMVSSGYNNFISANTDAATANNVITFLNKLSEDAVGTQNALDLTAQQKVAQEAEKKLKKSTAQRDKLIQKKAKLDKQIQDAEKEMEKSNKALEGERLKLENLKGRNGA